MTAPKSSTRLLSLDALRGVAVFLMIEQHVGIWIWRGPDPGHSLFDYPLLVGFNALGGMAAPLFVSLAGVGSSLFVAARRPRTDVTLVRRGLVLMLFGLALNLLSPSWFSWGTWFVLHMMGFAMALAPVWRRLSNAQLLVACALVLIATVAVQIALDTPQPLNNERMRDVGMAGGPFRLALAEGQFPILPWLTFYLAGFLGGRFIKDRRPGQVAKLALAFLALGGIGHGLLRMGVLPTNAITSRAFGLHLGFFPASVSIATLLLGGALLLISFGFWLEIRRPLKPSHPLVAFGRGSLTLLMLHVPLFRDWTRPVLWRALDANMALLTVFAFIIASAIGCYFWQRIGYRYGAEWLLRKIAG